MSTPDEVFDRGAIERWKRTGDLRYSFWLKKIPTEIRVTLTADAERGGFRFGLSHRIHTPEQAGPYRPSRPWGDDEEYALKQAVTAITDYYDHAVAKKHVPSAAWLV